MSTSELASVEPNALVFEPPFNRDITQCLFLHSCVDEPIAFKVRCTTPKRYSVIPSLGVLRPRAEVAIRVVHRNTEESREVLDNQTFRIDVQRPRSQTGMRVCALLSQTPADISGAKEALGLASGMEVRNTDIVARLFKSGGEAQIGQLPIGCHFGHATAAPVTSRDMRTPQRPTRAISPRSFPPTPPRGRLEASGPSPLPAASSHLAADDLEGTLRTLRAEEMQLTRLLLEKRNSKDDSAKQGWGRIVVAVILAFSCGVLSGGGGIDYYLHCVR